MATLANSSFLDMMGWRQTSATIVAEAYGWTADDFSVPDADDTITVALVLDRANDPTGLLEGNWASRQTALAVLQQSGSLGATYGADAATYEDALRDLTAQNIELLGADDGYVSSAESRTIWMNLNAVQFRWLFSQELKAHDTGEDGDVAYWDGQLSVRPGWGDAVIGLWIDEGNPPVPVEAETGAATALNQGPQSPGNALADATAYYPADLTKLYNFPLAGRDVTTATIGLLEPFIGIALPGSEVQDADRVLARFTALLNTYRGNSGISAPADLYVQVPGGQSYDRDDGGERSLDVGVVTSTSPNSRLGIYGGPIDAATAFPTYQAAIWDKANNPGVLSTSFGEGIFASPGSPFQRAYDELYIDAALRNISFLMAAGDSGSGSQNGNGVPGIEFGQSSPYIVTVGGTSVTTVRDAGGDQTLSTLLAAAMAGDPGTLQQLVMGGLKHLPSHAADGALFIETVWNQYTLDGVNLDPGYLKNFTGTGGVDPRQPQPAYQTNYGLALVGAGPFADTGRGQPDVSALSGGNMYYAVPGDNMAGVVGNGGTSAAGPFWAALTAQLQTIFEDQGLPRPGYMNDLLYQAAALSPGAFNDITIGNNISSFRLGGVVTSDGQQAITPTGFGYEATPGYDLATGLGTPNGLLLARTLTAIAHTQMNDLTGGDDPQPGLLATGGTLAATQHLLVQAHGGATTLAFDGGSLALEGSANAYAWSSAMAQKALQADFDPALVRLFDGAAQATPYDITLAGGSTVAVTVDGQAATTFRESLTNAFGFVDYSNGAGDLTLARAVAVAQTAGGADDQEAVVRLRSNTAYTSDSLSFYRVDDLAGTINGIAPGQNGYAAAAEGRSYCTTTGETSIAAPTDGGYAQARLVNIDQGDLIATRFSNGVDTFWAYSAANERDVAGKSVTHTWSYGLNTWGWEDLTGGGDQDFNDVLVQLDFTSTAGSQWLV